MLRTAGPDVYDQWVTHEIPFNDESVLNAAEIFGEVMFGEGYVLGGADQTPAIAFGDAPGADVPGPARLLAAPPGQLHQRLLPRGAVAGEDYDWFPFPPIDQEGTLIAGEFAVAFRNRPEIVDFLERFSSQEVQCARAARRRRPGSRPTSTSGRTATPTTSWRTSSEILTGGAGGRDGAVRRLRPDADRGRAGSFWTGMMEYMTGGPDTADARSSTTSRPAGRSSPRPLSS